MAKLTDKKAHLGGVVSGRATIRTRPNALPLIPHLQRLIQYNITLGGLEDMLLPTGLLHQVNPGQAESSNGTEKGSCRPERKADHASYG